MPLYTQRLKESARELRKNMTPQEKMLWDFLKQYKFKFYRQRPIGGYIVDFYCRKLRLIIEVDGSQHNTSEAKEYDEIRTEYMNSLGLTVIRFTNNEVNNNFSDVCAVIDNYAEAIMSGKSPMKSGGI